MSAALLGPAEMEVLRRLVASSTGVMIDMASSAIAEVRLGPLARREGVAGPRDLVERLRRGGVDGLDRRVVEALLNAETFFFRDVAPFEALRTAILPAAQRRAMGVEPVVVWSAACSTGQEPYSIALLVRDHLSALGARPFRLIASDVSRDALGRAREGRYSQLEVNRGLPARCLVDHFEKTGLEWRLREDVRGLVEFREINLLTGTFDVPSCDVILLRNVLIYLPIEARRAVLDRVRARLKPDGVLLLGSSETTLGVDGAFDIQSIGPVSFYRARGTRGGGGVTISETAIEEIIRTIWSLTLGLTAARDGGAGPEAFASTVRLTGPWNGRVILRCAPALARQAAATMFRTSVDQVVEADVRDALGELSNMVAGNLRSFLPRGCELSLPGAGEDPGGQELLRVGFAASGEGFDVRVIEDQGGSA